MSSWLDEFDPAHLNLGRALGESRRVDAAIGHCYLREFDAGWAVVNTDRYSGTRRACTQRRGARPGPRHL